MDPQDLPAFANPCADPQLAQEFFALVHPMWPSLTEESATYRAERDHVRAMHADYRNMRDGTE